MVDEEIFKTPENEYAGGEVYRERCPICGEIMEHGYVRSSTRLKWYGPIRTLMQRLIDFGSPFGRRRGLLGHRYDGKRCKECNLYIFDG